MTLLLAMMVSACSTSPPTIKQYEKDGIRFSHFSNWVVTEDAPIDGNPDTRSINLEGPHDAIITFTCVSPSKGMTVEQFAAVTASYRAREIEKMLSLGPIRTAEVNKGTSSPVSGRVGGQERAGILQRFNIRMIGEDVPHEAAFYVIDGERYAVMIMAQVVSESAKVTQPAFDLTLNSFSMAR